MKVYLIDDNPEKVTHLPFFLSWLKDSFPAFEFESGFNDPISAAESAESIGGALRDPDGLILLDLFMQGEVYEEAADQLLQSHLTCYDRRKEIWESLRHAAHQEGITKLSATVATLAEHYGTRLAWISNDKRVADILAQFYHLQNPKLPWAGTWSEPQRKDLAPLLENFRKPYLDATKAWNEMHSRLGLKEFSFPKSPKLKNMLFPADGSYGHVPDEHLKCSKLLAANRDATSDIVFGFLRVVGVEPQGEIDDRIRMYFLKFGSRLGQLHLCTLPVLFGERVSLEDIKINDGIACEDPGSLMLAIKSILSDSSAAVSFNKSNRDAVRMDIVFPSDEPSDTQQKLSMKPGQVMKGPPARATPGICVTALDYIRPDSLIAGKTKVIATKSFHKKFAT